MITCSLIINDSDGIQVISKYLEEGWNDSIYNLTHFDSAGYKWFYFAALLKLIQKFYFDKLKNKD